MSKEAMKKALQALIEWKDEAPYSWSKADDEAIESLKEALKQEQQKRAWVSLTNEEQQQLWDQWDGIDGWGVFYDSIEAALKEKNHV